MKKFEHLQDVFLSLNGRFNSYITTSFDDSMTVEMMLRRFLKEFQKVIDLSNATVDYLNEFIQNFDDDLEKTVETVLSEWKENGKLAEVIDLVLEDYKNAIENDLNHKKEEWIAYVEAMKEIIESIDPQGTLLNEIVLSRKTFPTLYDRLNFEEKEIKDEPTLLHKTISATLSPQSDALANGLTDYNLTHIKNIGADVVLCTLVNAGSTSDAYKSATLEQVPTSSIIESIEKAKAISVSVNMLKPHIVTYWGDSFDRATYNPTDVDLFFKNWETILLTHAKLCHDYSIPFLSIGCEMLILTKEIYTPYWVKLINKLKATYPDVSLTYASQSGEWRANEIQLFKYLDVIGINHYSNYSAYLISSGKVTQQEVNSRLFMNLQSINNYERISYLSTKYKKPIYMTEVGSMPQDDGLISFLSETPNNTSYVFEGQAYHMNAIFGVLCKNPHLVGVSWWHVAEPFLFFFGEGETVAEKTIKYFYKEVF